MEDLWRSRRPPEALDLDALLAPAGADGGAVANGGANPGAAAAAGGSACKALGLADAHAVWSVRQSAALFLRVGGGAGLASRAGPANHR